MWRTINKLNLLENVAPTRGRATLIIRKGPDHKVQRLQPAQALRPRRNRRRTRPGYPAPMLHLRLITPADRTNDVVQLIEKTVGTTHLVVLPGAARNPAGDVVMCDVAREAGDELIAGLRELDLDDHRFDRRREHRPVALQARRQGGEGRPRARARTRSCGSTSRTRRTRSRRSSITYVAFITLATMIAACGVVLDNAILIVGAMAVGPEFGPLAGLSTALVQRRPETGGPLPDRPAGGLRGGDGGDGRLQPLHGRRRPVHRGATGGGPPQHGLRLRLRLVLVRRGGPRRHRRHPLPDVGEVRRPGRRRHLRDHHPGGRERGSGPELRRHQPDLGLHHPAPPEPPGHHPGRPPSPCWPRNGCGAPRKNPGKPLEKRKHRRAP